MEANRFEGKSLRYLTIHPDGYSPQIDYPLIVLLHGFGASMDDLAGISPAIDREGYIYACPNGPLALDAGLGQMGYAWTPRGGESTEEDARRAVGLLDVFFEEVMEQYRVQPGRAILLGFSQGGGMTYRCGLPKPEVFAGLVALSSVMPDEAALMDDLPEERTQPIFIAHGVHDDLLPIERGRQALDFLQREGYSPQYKEYAMRHEISPEVLADLVPWINLVLPPAGAGLPN